MKKFVCVCLCVLFLLPVLLIPVAAADSTQYVFEYVEPVMPLGDDYFTELYDNFFVCWELLPDGLYTAQFVSHSGVSLYEFSLELDFSSGGVLAFPYLDGFEVFHDNWMESDCTKLQFPGVIPADVGSVVLTRVGDLSSNGSSGDASSIDVSGMVYTFSDILGRYFNFQNVAIIVGSALGLTAGLAIGWFAVRWLIRKVSGAFKKGRL